MIGCITSIISHLRQFGNIVCGSLWELYLKGGLLNLCYHYCKGLEHALTTLNIKLLTTLIYSSLRTLHVNNNVTLLTYYNRKPSRSDSERCRHIIWLVSYEYLVVDYSFLTSVDHYQWDWYGNCGGVDK